MPVLVAHSRESNVALSNQSEWRSVLQGRGLNPAIFEHIVVDLQDDPGVIVQLAAHIERFISILSPEDDIYVDLTNGQSLQKAALGAVAYVLGTRDQFIIDTFRIGRIPAEAGFLNERDLASAMVRVSDPMTFDSVAQAWFTEVRRFRELAGNATQAVDRILDHKDPVSSQLWQAEMLQAIRMWLAGQKEQQGVFFGAAVRHTGFAFEELVKRLHGRLISGDHSSKRGRKKLEDLINEIRTKVPDDLQQELIECLAHPLRKIRNASTHGLTPPSLGSRRARIGIEILLALVEYLDACFGSTAANHSPESVESSYKSIEGTQGNRYFFGLDGDNTGVELETLFCNNADERTMKMFSEKIESAVRHLAQRVTLPPINGEVIFCAGDDLLFSGAFDLLSLESFRMEYAKNTALSCSIGFGSTLREVYCALKMAKSRPGKNALLGIRLP